MLTDNQKDLLRLMVYHTQAKPDQMKTWSAMADDDILAILNPWVAAKKANPNTSEGTYNAIIALGG